MCAKRNVSFDEFAADLASGSVRYMSYLATIEDILDLPRLATVDDEPSMLEFFQ